MPAVTNYRRNFICGGSFFFTANLAERRLRLLVDDIVSAKGDGFRCRSTHPTALVKHRYWYPPKVPKVDVGVPLVPLPMTLLSP